MQARLRKKAAKSLNLRRLNGTVLFDASGDAVFFSCYAPSGACRPEYPQRKGLPMIRRNILNEMFFFGSGALQAVIPEMRRRRLGKALVLTDPVLRQLGVAARLTDLLDRANLPYSLFDQVTENPGIQTVRQAVRACQEAGAACLVALGGGSTQDTAKAVSLIAANPRHMDVLSLEGEPITEQRGLPLIAVPTTAGAGSEANMNFVVTDEKVGRKFICTDPNAVPLMAVIDPDLMAAMPPDLAAATGMDALTHAVEGYLTRGAWEFTDTLNLKAIELVARFLRKAVRGEPEAAANVALAQYMTGMTFANIGLGIVHSMAHPLSALYGTPHGLANAVLLPGVLAFNLGVQGRGSGKFRSLARALGVRGTDDMSLPEAARLAVTAVRLLADDLRIPRQLREVGVLEKDLPALAAMAMADACTKGNPRRCSTGEIEDLYRKFW